MSVSEIINIALAALAVIVGFIATYYKGNGKLVKAIAGYIAEAESKYTSAQSGGVKMQYVVGKLYALLPAVLRPFIPQAVIQTIVQAIFDRMADYAKQQLDKAVEKTVPEYTGTVIGTVPDTAAVSRSATGSVTATEVKVETSSTAAAQEVAAPATTDAK